MSRWFRFYADAMRHPKVAKLTDSQFRLWTELLSVACENGGIIPPADDLKHILKRRLDHLLRGLDDLIRASLIEALEDGYRPHGWDKRQYKSDTSTDRVQKHRDKRNVSVTPPEAETDTELAKASRAPEAEILGFVGEVARAAGVASVDQGRIAEQNLIVRKWIDAGADQGLILKTIERCAASAKQKPRSLQYFDGAVLEAIAANHTKLNEANTLMDRIIAGRKAA